MYCRNCGKEIDQNAAFCVHCGVSVGTGNGFCQNCGQSVTPEAQVCIHCGHVLYGNPNYQTGYAGYRAYGNGTPAYPLQKSRIAAGIIAILVGALGIHNFYLGYNARGTVQLLVTVLTCGVGAVPMGIWALVEGIMLLCGSTNYDARGIPLKD